MPQIQETNVNLRAEIVSNEGRRIHLFPHILVQEGRIIKDGDKRLDVGLTTSIIIEHDEDKEFDLIRSYVPGSTFVDLRIVGELLPGDKLPSGAMMATIDPDTFESPVDSTTDQWMQQIFHEHNFDRMTCYDHNNTQGRHCCPAGCHDLEVGQYDHWAELITKRGGFLW